MGHGTYCPVLVSVLPDYFDTCQCEKADLFMVKDLAHSPGKYNQMYLVKNESLKKL